MKNKTTEYSKALSLFVPVEAKEEKDDPFSFQLHGRSSSPETLQQEQQERQERKYRDKRVFLQKSNSPAGPPYSGLPGRNMIDNKWCQ